MRLDWITRHAKINSMKKKNQKNTEKKYKSGEVISMLEQIDDGIKIIGEQHKDVVKRLDGIDVRLEGMQEDVTEIKHKLSEKVDREEFNRMEKRMIKLEKFVFAKLG